MTNANVFTNTVSKEVELSFKKVVLARTNGSNEEFFKGHGTALVAEYEGKLIFIKYDSSSNMIFGILRTSRIVERSIGRFATKTFKTNSGTKYYYNEAPEKFAAEYDVKMELFNSNCQHVLGVGKVLSIEKK